MRHEGCPLAGEEPRVDYTAALRGALFERLDYLLITTVLVLPRV
jgi:hypothetical protein